MPTFLVLVAALTLIACAPVTGPNTTGAPENMPDPVYDLPHAQGRGFTSLDEYLAHLQEMGAQDRPFYVEIEPGIYERATGRRMPGSAPEPERFTRAELMEMFGFQE
ncbi:hypothetical protein [Maricaulis maris]|uniref:hypothetical protein n=1 Tax=Maricaulis maris TaxID=74318 RepID=UPI003B8E68D0